MLRYRPLVRRNISSAGAWEQRLNRSNAVGRPPKRREVPCLDAHEQGLSVGQIRQWLLDRTRGALCPSTTSLELALYLCPKVRRFGTSAPARFRIETGRSRIAPEGGC